MLVIIGHNHYIIFKIKFSTLRDNHTIKIYLIKYYSVMSFPNSLEFVHHNIKEIDSFNKNNEQAQNNKICDKIKNVNKR